MNLSGLELELATLSAEVVGIIILGWVCGYFLGKLIVLVGSAKKDEPSRLVLRIKRFVARSVALFTIIGASAAAALGAYLIYRGQNIWETQLEYLRRISPETRQTLALGALQVLVAAWVTSLATRWLERGVQKLSSRAKAIRSLKGNDESIERLALSLQTILTRCSWLAFSWFSSFTMGLPSAAVATLLVGIKVYAIVATGLLLWRSLDVVIATLHDLSKGIQNRQGWLVYYDKLEFLIPTARRSLEYIIYVTAASMAVSQVEFIASIAEWGPRVVRVIGYFFGARVGVALATLLTDEWAARKASNTREQNQRLLTLVPLFKSIQKYAIYFVVVVAILDAVGVNAGPILAGAGIAGLAVGFGAQSVIKDIVTGFFILFENYFVVGDFVQIGSTKGTVMGVDLRTTRLRDIEGGLHIIPNGDVTHVVHFSKDFANALVDVGVAYDTDLDFARQTLLEVGKQLEANDERVLSASEVLGVHELGESDVVIRTITKCKPGMHFEVARAYREAAKKKFDELGIEIPFARRVLILQDANGKEIEAKGNLPGAR